MTDLLNSLIDEIGPGMMSSTSYDTAWVARLGEIDPELGNHALDWICGHQLSDGSWGAEAPFYYHDRVISTLAAMIALTYRGRRQKDRRQIDLGLYALERIIGGATQGLQADPYGATVGFEMIVPTLVHEAERLGIIKQQGESILDRFRQQRAKKLARIQGKMISKSMTVAFSAEMAGSDGQHMLDINNLQEGNGSIGHSPSATAYFALGVKPSDQSALEYIRQILRPDGGAPNVAPFDVFEISWALWNLSLIPSFTDHEKIKHHIEFLSNAWKPSIGVGFAVDYSVRDSDDTGLVFDTLCRFGHCKDIESVLSFEEPEYFRCYDLEANPSISANIHVLGALRQADLPNDHPAVKKVITYLQSVLYNNKYWVDKWHSSPYYPTTHAVIACAGYADDLVRGAVDWLCSTQKADGSWGSYLSTAEETAYAIQALAVWNQKSGSVPKQVLLNGKKWLADHVNDAYPPLWIGKCLYNPVLVIRSAVISALALVG